MKEINFIFLSLVLVLILSACGSSADQTSNVNNKTEDKQYKLILNSVLPPSPKNDNTLINIPNRFAELVNERTDGRVTVDVFFGNQLVPPDHLMEALRKGTVDFGYSGPQYYGDLIPTAYFTNLPFFAKDIDHMMSLIRVKGIDKIFEKEMLEHGVKVLFYAPIGEYGFLSKEPIKSIEDLQGLNVREIGGLWIPWYVDLGAFPVNVSATEIYETLQRGIVDVVPFIFSHLDDHNYYEVVDSLTIPAVLPSAVAANFISLNTWDKLPVELQQIITDISKEIEIESIEKFKTARDEYLKFAKEKNIQIIELTDYEYNRFVESSQVVWDDFAKLNENTKQIVEILRGQLN